MARRAAAATPRGPSAVSRLFAAATAYLPLLLMALLALGTWWLVKNTALPEDDGPPAPPRHEPDYVMTDFEVQRFTAAGPLQARIEGAELRHYPDTDTLEIDRPRLHSVDADGRVTQASARRALISGDGDEVQLLGGAQVVREATAEAPALALRGEVLQAFLDSERVRSQRPVTLESEGTVLRADTLAYDHGDRVLVLRGQVRATFASPREGASRSRNAGSPQVP